MPDGIVGVVISGVLIVPSVPGSAGVVVIGTSGVVTVEILAVVSIDGSNDGSVPWVVGSVDGSVDISVDDSVDGSVDTSGGVSVVEFSVVLVPKVVVVSVDVSE